MSRTFRSVWVAAVFVATSCHDGADVDVPTQAAQVVAEAALGPVAGTLRMAPAEPRFGERVRFELEVTASAGAELEMPAFETRLGHFRIRDRKDQSQPERGRIAMTIVAEPERSGTNIVRLPVVRFRVTQGEGAGSERELSFAPFEVEVAGLTPDQEPDLAELGAPLPPVALPIERDANRALWIGGGVALLALGLCVFWWRRRGRFAIVEAPPIDPALEAARAFEQLLAQGLPSAAQCAEFYVRLTGIVRRYIERTTGVHAEEQTTEEFLRAMEGHAAFDAQRRQELSVFLAAADMVKFAAQVPDEVEIHGAVGAARTCCGLSTAPVEVAA